MKHNLKKLTLSLAVITAIGTSLMAYETNTKGELLNFSGQKSTISKVETQATKPLTFRGLAGDALIYPAFNQKDGFQSEFTVRNNKDYGIVARVTVYDGKDSHELKDFSIYLSANDVFRFVIKDGKLTSTDDSVVINASNTDDTVHDFASETNPLETTVDAEFGYVIVYGMMSTSIDEHGADAKDKIFETYRKALATKRPNWRNAQILEGVFVGPDSKGNEVQEAPYVKTEKYFGNVTNDALSGQVRISNTNSTERALLANAQGVQGFTENGKAMLWAPGELSDIFDRSIITQVTPNAPTTVCTTGKCPVTPSGVVYDLSTAPGSIRASAEKLVKKEVYYNFSNKGETPDVDNKLVITQIYKRALVNTGNLDGYFVKSTCVEDTTKKDLGIFLVAKVWNESEENPIEAEDGVITSPRSSNEQLVYCNEVAEDNRPEADTEFVDENGYIHYRIGLEGVPAIITQMTAEKVGESYRINWVDSLTK